MVLFLKEKGQTPREIYNWRLWLAACSAGLGGALFGYDTAFIGGSLALPSFKHQFGLENKTTHELNTLSSNIVIAFQAGCLGACFLSLPCAQTFGRRWTIFGATVIYLIGAAIQMSGNLGAFYAGRFLTGLGVGPLSSVCPMYAAEIAPPLLRGTCVGMFEIGFQLAALLGFWINYGVSLNISAKSKSQWEIPVSLQIPIAALLLLGCFFMPETPRFLIKQDRHEDALKTLSKLRHLDESHEYLRNEFLDTVAELRIERKQSGTADLGFTFPALKKQLRECFSKGMKRRIFAGIVTQAIGQLSGINGINYYAPTIYASFGIKSRNTIFLVIGFYGLARTIGSFFCYFFLIDRMGRRNLLFAGSFLMTLSMFYVGGYLKVLEDGPKRDHLSAGAIVGIAMIYLYAIAFIGSWSGIAYILPSECVPLNIRAISNTFSTVTLWTFNLTITKATPYMISSLHYGTFFFFGSWAVIGAIYVWFFIPETKGVPLEHIAQAFGVEDLVEVEKTKLADEKGTGVTAVETEFA